METRISVSNISTLREETYLCPSSVKYVKPVRAINSKGQWRIVLNHLEAKGGFPIEIESQISASKKSFTTCLCMCIVYDHLFLHCLQKVFTPLLVFML